MKMVYSNCFKKLLLFFFKYYYFKKATNTFKLSFCSCIYQISKLYLLLYNLRYMYTLTEKTSQNITTMKTKEEKVVTLHTKVISTDFRSVNRNYLGFYTPWVLSLSDPFLEFINFKDIPPFIFYKCYYDKEKKQQQKEEKKAREKKVGGSSIKNIDLLG